MSNLSFADLEKAAGETYVRPEGDMWPLEKWYDEVRRKPISGFTVEDLARALRQGTWIEHVLPVALNVLRGDPRAGALYEGELVVALKAVPKDYWMANREEAEDVRTIVQAALLKLEEDVQSDVKELLVRLA